jgi:hypothetical protein
LSCRAASGKTVRIMKPQILNHAPARNAPLPLGRGQHTWLHAAEATQLRAVDGIAWITFERGAGDVVLLPGQSITLAVGTTALIGPLHGPVALRVSGAFALSEREAGGPAPSRPVHANRRTPPLPGDNRWNTPAETSLSSPPARPFCSPTTSR